MNTLSKINIGVSKEKYKTIVAPPTLDDNIISGIERAKKRRVLRLFKPIYGAAAVFFLFMFLVNTSVAFAKVVNEVPVIRNFANAVIINPGIKYALKEGYIQDIDKSAEKDGIKITITRVIGDNKKLIFGYTVEGFEEKEGKFIAVSRISIEDESGTPLETFLSGGIGDYKDQGLKPLKNEKYFEIGMSGKDKLPKKINVVFKGIDNLNDIGRKEAFSGTTFKIPIELKGKILNVEPEIYEVNKTVKLGDLKLQIDEMRIYPMVTEVVVDYIVGKDNKFTWLDNGYLEDEKGRIFRLSSGSSSLEGDKYLLRFSGGAFNNSKELTLKAIGMFYQPIEDRFLVLDRKAQRLLDDGGYGIEYVTTNYREDNAEFVFKAKADSKIAIISLSFGDNTKYRGGYTSFTGRDGEQKVEDFGVKIDKAAADKDILKFAVSSIHKDKTESFSVKLK